MKKIYKNLIVSTVISLALLFCGFIAYNNKIPLIDDAVDIIKDYVYKNKSSKCLNHSGISPCFINLSYDQELVNCVVKYGENAYDSLGVKPHSDRKKIFRLLKELKKTDCLYVILDISLDESFKHPYNDSIVEVLKNMDNIILAKSSTENPLCDIVDQKSGYSRFVMWDNVMNFSKYELYNDTAESMPLMVYEAITEHKIKKYSLFAIDNGQLAHRCIYPHLYDYNTGSDRDIALGKNGSPTYPFFNIGMLLKSQDRDSTTIKGIVGRDNIVVIGNFDKKDNFDLYSTYVGDLHGSYINYMILETLLNEEHIVNYWSFIFAIFLLYIAIAMMILYDCSYSGFMQWFHIRIHINQVARQIILLIMSFLGYGFLFMFISYCALYFWNITFYYSLPTLVFTVMYNIYKKINYGK